jgi:hypothetical protein
MKKNILLLSLIILFSACSDMKMKPQTTTHQYFDMVAFMKTVLANLETSKVKVRKVVAANGIKEIIDTKDADWKQELALFIETDINKAVLKDMYFVNKNSKFSEYTALESNAKVQRIKIKGTSVDKPEEIEIDLIDKNQLYQTSKKLTMKFNSGKPISYTISGEQKVIFKDALSYEMIAEMMY